MRIKKNRRETGEKLRLDIKGFGELWLKKVKM